MAYDPNVFAEMVALTIKAALTPVLERVAGLEAHVTKALAVEPIVMHLRERLVVAESHQASLLATPITDLSPVLERVAATEARVARLAAVELTLAELRDKFVALDTKAAQPHEAVPSGPSAAELELLTRDAVEPIKAALATLQERIAVLEVRPLQPGPAGKDGAPGLDGKDGAPGQHGLAGLSYEGVYQEGKAYEPGQLATYGGSTWHCNEPTTSKPGEAAKDWTLMVKRGRDGRDGKDAETIPIVSLGRR